MAVTVEESVLVEFQADMNKFKRDMSAVQNKAKSTANGISSSIKTALAGVGIGLILKQFINISDEWTTLNNKIKLVTNSTEEFTSVQKKLFEISQNSYTKMSDTAELYQRLSIATTDLGTSQKDLLTVTDTINKSLIVSGASTAEVSSVITQLGQGLAAGALRGEEFNSVNENGARIMTALADQLGKTRGELKQMAAEGKLTADVVLTALIEQAGKVTEEFNKMDITTEQAMTNVKNSIGNITDKLNEASSTTSEIAEALQYLSKTLDENSAEIVEFFADVFRVFQLMGEGILLFGSGVRVAFLEGYKYIAEWINKVANGFELFKVDAINIFKSIADTVGIIFYEMTNYMLKKLSDLINSINSSIGGVFTLIGKENPFREINLSLGEYKSSLESATASGEDLINLDWTKSNLNDAYETQDLILKSIKDTWEAIANDTFVEIKDKTEEINNAQENIINSTDSIIKEQDNAKKSIKELQNETEKLSQLVADDLAYSMTSAINGWITGMDSFKDVTENVLRIIVDKFTELAVLKPFENFLSGIFGSGGINVASLFGGGGVSTNSILGAFASGGTAYQSGNYVVGERGPEVVNLPAGASVTPNHALGGTSVNINVNNYSNNSVDVKQNGDNIDIIISSIASGIQRGSSMIGSAIEARYGVRKI